MRLALASMSACCKTSPRSDRSDLVESGQSTVEAAVLIPTLALLLAMLVQPICLFYTRSVMWEAAYETARAVATARSMDTCETYALRRLDAVPDASVFHVGGRDDWQVSVSRSSDGHTAKVEISGHVRPLPLLGDVVTAFEERDGTGVVLRVSASERARPEWLEGSYGSWMGMWG